MKNTVSAGLTIDHTPAAARAAGACTLIGVQVGVAMADVAANAEGPFAIEGVFELPKLSTDNMTQGAQIYWDNTNLRWTLTSAGNTAAGKVFKAAAASTTTVQVKINV